MADTYRTIQGDTWDMIAKRAYGDERRMDWLMSNNFPLLDRFIFPAGVEVRTPPPPQEDTEGIPEWRRG